MLILTRRVGESLKVGDNVTLTVLGVKGNQVRIGSEAPKDLAVHREEIWLRAMNDKIKAGHTLTEAEQEQLQRAVENQAQIKKVKDLNRQRIDDNFGNRIDYAES